MRSSRPRWSGSRFVVELRTAAQRAGSAGELPLDACQLALGGKERLLILERPGELFGVAGEVGLLTGKAVLRCLELSRQGVEKMLQTLEQAGAVGQYLVQIECAHGRVLERVASLRAPQAEADG